MTTGPRMSNSPSAASLAWTPCTGRPTVPTLRLSAVVMVDTPVVSDIPHTSRTGIPSPRKKTSTSGGMAAAPLPAKVI